MAENKVKFGLTNVYYAVATIDSNNAATYATPVRIPGSVSMSIEPQGENSDYYADNIVYYTSNGNTGYSGTLEIANVPESFEKDVLGMIEDSKGVLVEDQDAEVVHFALLYEFDGDQSPTRRALYNCTCSRVAEASNTKGETTEPINTTLNLSCKSVYNASLQKNIIKSKTSADVDATTYSSWFTTVHAPVAST